VQVSVPLKTTVFQSAVIYSVHFPYIFSFATSGLSLQNYVQEDYQNTTLEVLSGVVAVKLDSTQENVTLSAGQKIQVADVMFMTFCVGALRCL